MPQCAQTLNQRLKRLQSLLEESKERISDDIEVSEKTFDALKDHLESFENSEALKQKLETFKKMVFKMLNGKKKSVEVDGDEVDESREYPPAMMKDWRDPLKWMVKFHLPIDIKMGKNYEPAKQVLGNRERSRQYEIIKKIGEKTIGRPNMYYQERDGNDKVYAGYRDNRDKAEHREVMLKLEKAFKKSGFKTRKRTVGKNDPLSSIVLKVLFDQNKVSKMENIHSEYVKLLKKEHGMEESKKPYSVKTPSNRKGHRSHDKLAIDKVNQGKGNERKVGKTTPTALMRQELEAWVWKQMPDGNKAGEGARRRVMFTGELARNLDMPNFAARLLSGMPEEDLYNAARMLGYRG